MKYFDWTIFVPGQLTLLLLPGEVVAVRSTRLLHRTVIGQIRRFPLRGAGGLPEALANARDMLGIRKESYCHVGMPLQAMTLVSFSLPLAAREDLPAAVRLGLMRHLPYQPDEMRWNFTSQERGDSLDISVALVQTSALDELLGHFNAAGISVASVFPTCMLLAGLIPEGGIAAQVHAAGQEVLVWNGQRICWQGGREKPDFGLMATASAMLENYGIASRRAVIFGDGEVELPPGLEAERVGPESLEYGMHQPFSIGLVPESEVRKVRRLQYTVLASTIALLLTIVLQPFQDVFLWQKRLADLEARVGALRGEAESLISIRQSNSEIRDRLERWGRRLSQNVSAPLVLGEITRLLPREAWLESLQIQDGKVILNGNAPSATFVLEQMENSAVFDNARFDAPVTRMGELEIFRIVATISPK